MFSIELKFTIDLLVSWFDKTHKSRFLEINPLVKQKYDKENKLDPLTTKCCICDMRLDLNSALGPQSDEMTYLEFTIKKSICF